MYNYHAFLIAKTSHWYIIFMTQEKTWEKSKKKNRHQERKLIKHRLYIDACIFLFILLVGKRDKRDNSRVKINRLNESLDTDFSF